MDYHTMTNKKVGVLYVTLISFVLAVVQPSQCRVNKVSHMHVSHKFWLTVQHL
jgi:hypothetical protein